VVLLHGSGGAQDDAHLFTEPAVALTRLGYACLMPNYYDATPGQQRSSDAARRQWQRAIMDGIRWMGAQPGLDPARVGAVGFSRGAGLVMDGALRDGGPAAVVAIGGGGAPEPGDIRHRPPVLLLWSTGDAERSDGGLTRLEARLREGGVPVEAETFASPDHRFDPAAGRVAFARIETFFGRTLARRA
jgi:dienelactone hydrolase